MHFIIMVKNWLKDFCISQNLLTFAENNRPMLKQIIKWIAWIITVSVLFYVGTAVFLFYRICTTTVYNTPWGMVDTDTAKIGFIEFWCHEPCYEAYRETVKDDTVRYYFFKARSMYYKAYHDSLGNIKIINYYPYRDNKDGEECTEYFRKEDIFIK